MYIFLTISVQRESVLSNLINKLYQTKYRGLTEGYLRVAENRREAERIREDIRGGGNGMRRRGRKIATLYKQPRGQISSLPVPRKLERKLSE